MTPGDRTDPDSAARDGDVRGPMERERAASLAFEAMVEPVMARDDAGRITLVNRAFLRTFGGRQADWIGVWFAAAPASGQGVDLSQVNGPRRYDVHMATRDGAAWIEWTESPTPGGGSVAVGRDVTAARQASAAISEAAQGKSVFFAAVTHELRTPLSGALGLANLLADTQLKPDQRAYVEGLKSSAGHALALIDDILDLSRLEAGKLALRAEPVDPVGLMEMVCELLAPKAHEKGLELAHAVDSEAPRLIKTDPGRLKQILFNLIGNAVKFTQTGGALVTLEAVAGTLRFTVLDTGPGIAAENQTRLFEQFERGAADDSPVAGAGLGLAMVRRLAEAMHGSVGLHSEPGSGAAFWFAFEPELIEPASSDQPLHDRAIIVASPSTLRRNALRRQSETLGARVTEIDRIEPGGSPASGPAESCVLLDESWAEFAPAFAPARVLVVARPDSKDRYIAKAAPPGVDGWLVAPVRLGALAQYALSGSEPAREPAPDQATGEVFPLAGLRILVAEDDPVNALIARRVLERLGAEILEAASGREAVEAVRVQAPDAALLDLRMPELDGRATARAIRALPAGSGGLPLIALTANATEADREACLEAGMNEFLTKPLDAEALTEALTRLCVERNRASLSA
ncbi:MAG: ATP-binding protein [Pseudomonadota bacterium]